MVKKKKKGSRLKKIALAALLGGAVLFPLRRDFNPRTGVYNPKATASQRYIIAHRGGTERYRENSLNAFSHVKETGADKAELDIRKTRDGVFVVHHDRSISGTPISRVSFKKAKELALKNGYELSRLEEVLEVLNERDVGAVADLKISGYETDIVKILKKYMSKDKLIVSSRSPSSLKKIKDMDKDVKTSLIMHASVFQPYSYVRRKLGIVPWRHLKYSQADYVCVRGDDLNPRFYRNASKGDVKVIPYNVSGRNNIRTVLDKESVYGIITGSPSEAVKARDGKSKKEARNPGKQVTAEKSLRQIVNSKDK